MTGHSRGLHAKQTERRSYTSPGGVYIALYAYGSLWESGGLLRAFRTGVIVWIVLDVGDHSRRRPAGDRFISGARFIVISKPLISAAAVVWQRALMASGSSGATP